MAANNHIELVEKGMSVLEALAENGESSSLQDLASRVGLLKSSVFRILYTLRELGYVEQSGRGTYRLTHKMFSLARRAPAKAKLTDIAYAQLLHMRDVSGETASLAEWRRHRAVLINVVETRHKLRLSLDVGDECPLHASALGKAIAAHLAPEQLSAALRIAELQRFTDFTITDHGQLLRELALVRKNGFAVNQEETVEGAVLIGAAIHDSRGVVCAAVSLSCPVARCSEKKRNDIIQLTKTAAAAISREMSALGYCADAD